MENDERKGGRTKTNHCCRRISFWESDERVRDRVNQREMEREIPMAWMWRCAAGESIDREKHCEGDGGERKKMVRQ
jgi:hypothetical protein